MMRTGSYAQNSTIFLIDLDESKNHLPGYGLRAGGSPEREYGKYMNTVTDGTDAQLNFMQFCYELQVEPTSLFFSNIILTIMVNFGARSP